MAPPPHSKAIRATAATPARTAMAAITTITQATVTAATLLVATVTPDMVATTIPTQATATAANMPTGTATAATGATLAIADTTVTAATLATAGTTVEAPTLAMADMDRVTATRAASWPSSKLKHRVETGVTRSRFAFSHASDSPQLQPSKAQNSSRKFSRKKQGLSRRLNCEEIT